MKVKVCVSRLHDVITYCTDKHVKPFFYEKLYASICNSDFVDIDISLLNEICKWCETENICDNLDSYGDFYLKFKRIIDDVKYEQDSLFDLYN
jgi:hypothetical protein